MENNQRQHDPHYMAHLAKVIRTTYIVSLCSLIAGILATVDILLYTTHGTYVLLHPMLALFIVVTALCLLCIASLSIHRSSIYMKETTPPPSTQGDHPPIPEQTHANNPVLTQHQRRELDKAVEMHLKYAGVQTRMIAARFDPELIPGTALAMTGPVPSKLREYARNMHDYLDWDTSPPHIIMGDIPTPQQWDAAHASNLIDVFHSELNDAKKEIPTEVHQQILHETLKVTAFLLAWTSRDYSRHHMDRMAKGPESK